MLTSDPRFYASVLAEKLGWAADPKVSAVFIIGSAASGRWDQYSDLDLVIVTDHLAGEASRIALYRRWGGEKIMAGFFHAGPSVLHANILAVDKVVIPPVDLDFCYCSVAGAVVYAGQPMAAVKNAGFVERLGAAVQSGLRPEAARLRYACRILVVHRQRYERWARRHNWLQIDLGPFLFAAREMLLVLGGRAGYNNADPSLWRDLAKLNPSFPEAHDWLASIKQLDDRVAAVEKMALMDRLIERLGQLCQERGFALELFD